MEIRIDRRFAFAFAAFVLAAGAVQAQQNPSTSFFGGNNHDRVQGCGVGLNGRVLVCGNTGSTNFSSNLPLSKGGYQTTFQGWSDAFVAVVDSDLSTVIAWTYLGGNYEDRAYGVKSDAQGRIWVVGFTESSNFPHTTGPGHQGANDCFVARFSSDLKQLQMCRIIGGSADESPRGSFELDAQGNVYLGGHSGSADFPTTPGVFQEHHAPGAPTLNDAIVVKLNSSGQIVWSTFFGGSKGDSTSPGVALASDGSVVLGGATESLDLPVTANALQPFYGGDSGSGSGGDGFVARLSSDGSQLLFSTYLGGSSDDTISPNDGMVLDDQDRIIVLGSTQSFDFPLGAGGWRSVHTSSWLNDAFVVRIAADGSQVLNGTYIGGNDFEEACGIDIDSTGNVYTTGTTRSTDFPVTVDALQPDLAGGPADAYVTKFSADLSELLYSTYVGGSGTTTSGDRGRCLVVTGTNQVLLSGDTDSQDFPTTSQVFDPTYDGGATDGYISTVSLGETYSVGQGKQTSQNKFSTLSMIGAPSAAAGSFQVRAVNAMPNTRGMLVWGDALISAPFAGGTLYAKPPLNKLPVQITSSTGVSTYALNIAPSMVGQTRVYQFLFMDPGQSDGTQAAMSNALKVVFTP